VRVEGTDKPGVGAAMTEALADLGLNLRGVSGASFGRQFIAYLALDTAEDAAIAIETLKKLSFGAGRGGQKTPSRSKSNRLRSLNNPRHRQRSTGRASRRRTRTV
jgi:predicted amino acid-binding ACT domain protein